MTVVEVEGTLMTYHFHQEHTTVIHPGGEQAGVGVGVGPGAGAEIGVLVQVGVSIRKLIVQHHRGAVVELMVTGGALDMRARPLDGNVTWLA